MKKLILPLLLLAACSKEPMITEIAGDKEISNYSNYLGTYDYQGDTIELAPNNEIRYYTQYNGVLSYDYYIFNNNTFSDYYLTANDTLPFTFSNDSLIVNGRLLIKH